MNLGLNKLPWYGVMLIAGVIGGAGMGSYFYLYAGFPKTVTEVLPLGDGEGTLRANLAQKEMQLARERQDRLGLTQGMVRISVGIEDVEDLLADLDQALSAI